MRVMRVVIESFAKWFIGGVPFQAMKAIVSSLDDRELSGSAKREVALEQFSAIGYSLAAWAVNLLLELAVAWLKNKKPEG